MNYGVAFAVSTVFPLALLMTINCVIFLLVFQKIYHHDQNPSKNVRAEIKKLSIKRLRTGFCMSILLGLTWISGLVALIDGHTAPQWFFLILVSSQGLFIFLVQRTSFLRFAAKAERRGSTASDLNAQFGSGVTGTLLRRARKRVSQGDIDSLSSHRKDDTLLRRLLRRFSSQSSASPASTPKRRSTASVESESVSESATSTLKPTYGARAQQRREKQVRPQKNKKKRPLSQSSDNEENTLSVTSTETGILHTPRKLTSSGRDTEMVAVSNPTMRYITSDLEDTKTTKESTLYVNIAADVEDSFQLSVHVPDKASLTSVDGDSSPDVNTETEEGEDVSEQTASKGSEGFA